MALPPKWYQFLIGVFASLGSFLFGYDLGVIAEVVASPNFTAKFKPNDVQSGLVVSMFTTAGALIFCLGGALQTGAQNIHFLWSGRFFAGLGVGILVMIIPLYQAELAHPPIRGRITALQQFMLGVGALVAGWVSYGTYIDIANDNSGQWRIPLGLQLLPAIALGALIMLFPESPRWLIDHGRADEGLQTLTKLHAHGDTEDPWVRAEYEQIQEAITFEHGHEAKSYFELFQSRSSFRRLFLCCALQASIQMTGVSAIQYYSVTIYGKIGITGNNTLKYQAINNIIALIAQFLCMMLIDKFGRRRPLIFGNLGNMVTFIIATILLAKYPPGTSNNTGAQWGFIIMTWLYNFSFSATCGPLSWIIPAEVFDTRTRSKGVSIATMTSFAFNTMIGQVTPIAMTNIGYRYYYLFIICNFTNAVFFWLLLPETARKPLEEMNSLFSNTPWIVVGQGRKERVRQAYETRDLEAKVEAYEQKRDSTAVPIAVHEEKL